MLRLARRRSMLRSHALFQVAVVCACLLISLKVPSCLQLHICCVINMCTVHIHPHHTDRLILQVCIEICLMASSYSAIECSSCPSPILLYPAKHVMMRPCIAACFYTHTIALLFVFLLLLPWESKTHPKGIAMIPSVHLPCSRHINPTSQRCSIGYQAQ